MALEEECIFCKIVTEDIGCAKIWEDEKHIAFLDINPNTEGMTLVIPKDHYNSYAFEMPDTAYTELMIASKKVAKILEKGLDVKRVAMVMEGMGVNHVHIKLYPIHGIKEIFEVNISKEIKYFKEYEGYISTHLGPKKDLEELEKFAEKIREKNK
ncbi:HIT family protein [Candidatus Micrarchaeota archaeon]|nr:HIT family protein [Candidatus Micrarchaeota archaeon]